MFKSEGAFRHHFLRGYDSRVTKYQYGHCQRCEGVYQSVGVDNQLRGLGSSTRRHPTLDEILTRNRLDEKARRVFRFSRKRCKCDEEGDTAIQIDTVHSEEYKERQQHYSQPDIPSDGWYKDPSGIRQFRFWDGRQWTGHVTHKNKTFSEPMVVPNGWMRLLPGDQPLPKQNRASIKRPVPGVKKKDANITEQLLQLSELHKTGVLSSSQFEAAKNKLLGLDE
jgi:hypothetical protein